MTINPSAPLKLGAIAFAMIFTGLVTVYLCGVIDPLAPKVTWHILLSGVLIVVIWPAPSWTLNRCCNRRTVDLLPALWW
jgi:hypothetical protein